MSSLRLVDPVAWFGPQWVAYEAGDGSALAAPLAVGQWMTVHGENSALAEQVRVLAVSATPRGHAGAGPCFEADFTKPHDIGASIAPAPILDAPMGAP